MTSHHCGTQSSPLSDVEKDIALKNFELMHKSIENSYAFCLALGKVYLALLGALSFFAVFIFQEKGQISANLLKGHGFGGIAFSVVVFIAGIYFVGVFRDKKVERILYHKAINALRQGFSERTNLSEHLILPKGDTYKGILLPRLTHRDMRYAYPLAFINFVPLMIGVFFSITFANGFRGMNVVHIDFAHCLRGLTVFYPVLCIAITGYGSICMRYKSVLLEAELCNSRNMHVKFENIPPKESRKGYRRIGYAISAIVVIHYIFVLCHLAGVSCYLPHWYHLPFIVLSLLLSLLHFVIHVGLYTSSLINAHARARERVARVLNPSLKRKHFALFDGDSIKNRPRNSIWLDEALSSIAKFCTMEVQFKRNKKGQESIA